MLVNAYIIYESIDRARMLTHKHCRVQRSMLLTRGGDVVTAPAKLPKCVRVEKIAPRVPPAAGKGPPRNWEIPGLLALRATLGKNAK